MNTVEQGFLYKKGRKIKVNHKKTNSVLLNNLQIDFILRKKKYIKGYLLDAGCGEKPYSLIYKDITKKSVGCDVEYCIHDQKKVDVFASLDNLPFQNNTFDTVLCTNVLEHVAENEKSFFELSRVLKNKGYIILSVPFLYPTHEVPHDFYRYSFYGLKYQMEKNGLKIVKAIPWGGIGMMILVYCNLFLCKFLKIGIINSLACFFQEGIYTVYHKIFLNYLVNEGIKKKMLKTISMGYFIVAQKNFSSEKVKLKNSNLD